MEVRRGYGRKGNESRIVAVEMRAVSSMRGVRLGDRIRSSVISYKIKMWNERGRSNHKIEKGMWFGQARGKDDRK